MRLDEWLNIRAYSYKTREFADGVVDLCRRNDDGVFLLGIRKIEKDLVKYGVEIHTIENWVGNKTCRSNYREIYFYWDGVMFYDLEPKEEN